MLCYNKKKSKYGVLFSHDVGKYASERNGIRKEGNMIHLHKRYAIAAAAFIIFLYTISPVCLERQIFSDGETGQEEVQNVISDQAAQEERQPEITHPTGASEPLPKALADISGAGTLPELTGEAAVLIDAQSGQVLYNKNMNDTHYPASTTKVLTAILTLENLSLENTVEIDHEASFTTGSRIYLIEGEQVTVSELMYAMMLESANDAAVALAKKISGTVEDFASLMNRRAEELGAENTHFTNPNGLPDEAHVTTAYDLAMMAKKGLEYEAFRHFVSTVSYEMQPTNKQPEKRIFNNSNRLLFDESRKFDYDGTLIYAKYKGATGVKTGFTKAAGSCIVASAQRDGRELLAVVLKSNSEQIFVDAIKLFDYGFTYYDGKRIIEDQQVLDTVKVKNGENNSVEAVADGIVSLTIPVGEDWGEIETAVDLPSSVKAPVEAGDRLGTVTVTYNGETIGTVDAVASGVVPPAAGLAAEDSILGKILRVLKIIGLAAIVLLLLFGIFVCVVNYLYRKKKRAMAKRRRNKRGSAYK